MLIYKEKRVVLNITPVVPFSVTSFDWVQDLLKCTFEIFGLKHHEYLCDYKPSHKG